MDYEKTLTELKQQNEDLKNLKKKLDGFIEALTEQKDLRTEVMAYKAKLAKSRSYLSKVKAERDRYKNFVDLLLKKKPDLIYIESISGDYDKYVETCSGYRLTKEEFNEVISWLDGFSVN